jgi:hypothetical protein
MFLVCQNENNAFWVKNVSGIGLSRKSFKNGCCRRHKQNCDLRLAWCFGRLLLQINAEDHLDNLLCSLCAVVLASIKKSCLRPFNYRDKSRHRQLRQGGKFM